MDIKEFAEIIKKRLEERTGLEVRLVEVTKNNSVTLHGINIIVAESSIVPTIYLEQYLQAYKQGMDLAEITEDIIRVWEREKKITHLDVEWFRDFDKVRERIAYKLVNCEANKKLLEDVPHVPFLNLVKVYYVSIKLEREGEGTILIHNSHMDLWNVTAEKLDEAATENTQKMFPAVIESMEDILQREMPGVGDLLKMPEEYQLYVASNAARTYGAAVMCYPNIIKKFAEQRKSDLLIIPSSVHEVLILPYEEDTDSFREMVREVNKTQLQPEEILSYSVYVYRRATDSISIA